MSIAAHLGDITKVYDLLKAGVDPNVGNNCGWTPLHNAAGSLMRYWKLLCEKEKQRLLIF